MHGEFIEHALVIFTWLSIQLSSSSSSTSNSHRNWEKGNKNHEIENLLTVFAWIWYIPCSSSRSIGSTGTSFDGDLELCATVHNQIINYPKQWIQIEWNENEWD
jgi:hypothetical protein